MQPDDLIVYCPDQIGPDVARLLPASLRELTFPRLAPPAYVDWIDYQRAITAASPAAFVAKVASEAGVHSIWLVWANGHFGVDNDRVGGQEVISDHFAYSL